MVKMKKFGLVLPIILLVSLVVALEIGTVKADTTICIKQSGEIQSTDLIKRDGNVYLFTSDIYFPIVVERNNIILDGNGYTLEGFGSGWAINLTTSNVTVRNLHIKDWHTGILGVYNNNTIRGNVITGCNYSIRIYANNYNIVDNYITNNEEGILMQGSSNVVSNNNITNNNIGLDCRGENRQS